MIIALRWGCTSGARFLLSVRGRRGGIDLGPGGDRAFFISLLVRHVRDLPPQLEDGSCRARREGEGLQNIEDAIHGVLLPWLERRPHADTAGASLILRHALLLTMASHPDEQSLR